MATEKDLINGNSRKKKINEIVVELQEAKRKKLNDSCDDSRKGFPVNSPMSEIQICKCSHQCHKLTIEDRETLFDSFYQKTYDEQSEYIISHCINLIEPKKRKSDKSVSQRSILFHYQFHVGSEIVAVCQKTLCNVLGVSSRRIQALQNKIKITNQEFNLLENREKHDNRLHEINEEIINKIQEHINLFSFHENFDNTEIFVSNSEQELLIAKMHQLFCEKYPEIQISKKIYNDVWKETFFELDDDEFLEDIDDPVNDRLIYENNFADLRIDEETVRDSLEADGQLGRIKAEMRTEVMKLLDGSSKSSRVKRPKSPHDVLLLNELIREYFDWIGYKYTSNVFITECELGKQPLDRSFLAQDLGVRETEKSRSLPLLFCLIEAFKELKASSLSSC